MAVATIAGAAPEEGRVLHRVGSRLADQCPMLQRDSETDDLSFQWWRTGTTTCTAR